MKKAGAAAWKLLQSTWPDAQTIVVYCGGGNNAGDGYYLAACGMQQNKNICVVALTAIDDLTDIAKVAALHAVNAGVTIYSLEEYYACGINADVIVDAILGIGCNRKVVGNYAAAIADINKSNASVLSIDVPSGLNADTGEIYNDAICADVTITFLAAKIGCYVDKGIELSGRVIIESLCDLDIDSIEPHALLMQKDTLPELLPKRLRNTHKGDFGHVLVIGGDYGMGGAVRMAAEAAMRVGSGLVTVATRPEHINIVVGARPEIMCNQIDSADQLTPLIDRATVIVIGPGLGQSPWAESLFELACKSNLPIVIDADGLNLLSQHPVKIEKCIITPHPGEAARLLGSTVEKVQSDRYLSVNNLQQKYSDVAILKGAGTLVKTHDQVIALCAAGNPGMATGGMGDVLSGVIGGLLAQNYSLQDAAQIGVLIHSMAADQAAEQDGERGLLASDVLQLLRPLVNPDDS